MTQIPAGWYPDPDPAVPPQSRGQRYWDGTQWTEHVQPPAAPAPQAYPSSGGAPTYQAGGEQHAGTGGGYPSMPGYAAGGQAFATTPDGDRLSGWWRRVGAYVIDLVILTPLVFILAWPWMSDLLAAYTDLVNEALDASQTGAPGPDPAALADQIAGPLLMVTVIGVVVNFVYNVTFLKWKAATPGKMVLGLKVRLREVPGPLSWGTVLMRWLGQHWYSLASAVPIIGGIVSLWPFIDLTWPLWDSKKQALHDKVARTNVIRTR